VQRRQLEAKELGRPGGEAAARGSRVVAEAAVVDSPRLAIWRNRMNEIDIFRINVELELLHPSAEASVQVPGLRLGADCETRLLKGHRRLGSRRDRLGPRLGLGLGLLRVGVRVRVRVRVWVRVGQG